MPSLESVLSDLFPPEVPFAASIVREVEEEDMLALSTMKVGAIAPKLKNLRAVHHQAARLIATGMKQEEVSLHTGLCSSRLSILKADPTFGGLVEFYLQTEGERFADVRERMVQLGLTSAEALMERIIEAPEEISTKDLTEILKSTLDRGGHAPIARSESKHLHATIPSEVLLALKGEISNGGTIHAKHCVTESGGRTSPQLPAQAGALEIMPAGGGDLFSRIDLEGALQQNSKASGGEGPGTDV